MSAFQKATFEGGQRLEGGEQQGIGQAPKDMARDLMKFIIYACARVPAALSK
jgi:hypothetical protein